MEEERWSEEERRGEERRGSRCGNIDERQRMGKKKSTKCGKRRGSRLTGGKLHLRGRREREQSEI